MVGTHKSGDLPDATRSGSTAPSLDDLRALADTAGFKGGMDGVFPTGSIEWQSTAPDAIGRGIDALDAVAPAVLNLLCLPNLSLPGQDKRPVAAQVYRQANACCECHRTFLIVDPPAGANRHNILSWPDDLGGTVQRNAALDYPRLAPIR